MKNYPPNYRDEPEDDEEDVGRKIESDEDNIQDFPPEEWPDEEEDDD
jgi:hypothetical protein